MSHDRNTPIRFRLGTIALWNVFTKRTIDYNDPTLSFLKKAAPDQFEALTSALLPTTMEAK